MQKSTLVFLIIAVLCLVASASIGVYIVIKLDPDQTKNLVFFYIDLFVFTASITSILGFGIRRMFGAREQTPQHTRLSIRQALWFGILVVASFLLLGLGVFSFLNALLLALSLVFLESYFLSK